MNFEIERKFLVKYLPPHYHTYPSIQMQQGYLSTSPVLRIRQENDTYLITYKSAGFLKKREENLPLTKEGFLHLLPKCDGIIIHKVRYQIPLGDGLVAELDIFDGEHKGLMLVEVEFDNLESANAFLPPDWFGQEVTKVENYHNSYLSTHPTPR